MKEKINTNASNHLESSMKNYFQKAYRDDYK